jgi:hypothetical protein
VKYHTKFRLLILVAGVADPGSVHFTIIFYADFDTIGYGVYATRISGGGYVPTRN